jgi:hypothetical protein
VVYFVRVAIPGKVPLGDGRTEVGLMWQVLRKSLEWVKEKLA